MTRRLKRRRKEAKTDYRARLALLKSEKPRLVIRRTNRYLIAQLVESDIAQDKVIMSVTSKDLISKGWPSEKIGSLKSLPAAYLTGYLIGKMGKQKIKEAVLDIGMHRNMHKSRIYAVLKGAVDAGLIVPHSKEALPEIDKITKNKQSINIEKIKEKM
ncbi:MAG: 50S ribosomal protein L18 [Nanoarchaeota archaeon]|nr:50S ribosomal protein L18 [Nanoarchaeota archaeon]